MQSSRAASTSLLYPRTRSICPAVRQILGACHEPRQATSSEQWVGLAGAAGSRGLRTVAVASKSERGVLERLRRLSSAEITCFDDLTLPEITAFASRAALFVGNDSGIAHIAAAVGTPTVVIFGPGFQGATSRGVTVRVPTAALDDARAAVTLAEGTP